MDDQKITRHGVASGWNFMAALRENGTVAVYGFLPDDFDVSGWGELVSISADGEGMIGVTKDGRVLATGIRRGGRYGWTKLSECGVDRLANVTAAKLRGGVILTENGEGALMGLLVESGSIEPASEIRMPSAKPDDVVLEPDGRVRADGLSGREKEIVESWTELVDIACGSPFVIGRKKDGSVVTVGERYPALTDGEAAMNRKLRE